MINKKDLGNRIEYRNELGQLHREDGPAVEWTDGTHYWYLNGKMHREDGPAVEYLNGAKMWYINGERHREDGPAIEHSNGYEEWWLHGQELTETEFKLLRFING